MTGISGGLVLALLYYTLFLVGVCALVWLATHKVLKGLTLIYVTVLLAVAITIVAFASGMAKSDFTFAMVLPFIVGGTFIAAVWTIAYKMRSA